MKGASNTSKKEDPFPVTKATTKQDFQNLNELNSKI